MTNITDNISENISKNNSSSNKTEKSVNFNMLVLMLGFAGFVSAADNWFVSPAISAIATEFSISISMAGVVLTSYMIPYGFLQPFYGFFGDYWNKYSVLKYIVCGLAIGTLGSAFASSLLVLCIFRIITGFFAAGIVAVSLALIGDTVPVLDRQIYVGKFMGIVFLGQGLSAGLGGLITKFISWRGAFVFFAIAATISAIILLTKSPKDKKIVSNGKGNFFYKAKRTICSAKGRIIFPLSLITGFLLLGVYSYLGAFLNKIIGLDYLQCGIVIMFYGFSCLIGGTKVGNLSKKIGKKNVILLGEFFALIAILFLYFLHYWQFAILATILLGLGYISIQSTLATLAFDITDDSKGLSSGLIGLGLFGGGGLGSLFSGWLLFIGGYQVIWLVFFSVILLFICITLKIKLY
ncbi:MFS transporter [Clostridium sp. YIM B02555]|uniref:MFS transporter n=1 Tax=Clostridium sp. YIM B02555 TaxID=2911968 RepID=UPI001EEE5AB7|nr:MFS transporter [Clostridium sp. YIM B02555]